MMDAFAGTLAVLLVIYMIVAALILPIAVIEHMAQENKCAAEHNVFACEKVVTWRPIVPEGK